MNRVLQRCRTYGADSNTLFEDEKNEDEAKQPRPQPEPKILRFLHDTLILSNAAISSLTTSAGSGA